MQYSKEVKTARLKELKSWLDHEAGYASLTTEYSAKAGLRPLPSRHVTEFKFKEGVKIIKDRLVLKGFAERNTHTLNTAAPTATRLGHKMVVLMSVLLGKPLWSLDVSTAFLQGWSFKEMESAGYARQPVAMMLDAETWKLLSELAPDNALFRAAARDPTRYCFVLLKAAYGLKDAPLLWNLRLVSTLVKLNLRRSAHDHCCFYLVSKCGTKVDLMISIHVDDTLLTGTVGSMMWLHAELQRVFGPLKKEENSFRHFGINITKDVSGATLSQQEYLKNLVPVTVTKVRGSGKTQDSPAEDKEVADFRSLVAGIAWVGVTHGGAQAMASLYQGFLPSPTVKQVMGLNAALEQLRDQYKPLKFSTGFTLEDLKLVPVCDSSLGNNSKYSQGAHALLLCAKSDILCSNCLTLSTRSGKSKRVANSSMAAETLALLQGCEEALLVQTWLHELRFPSLSARELLEVSGSELTEMFPCTDCEDLHITLVQPAAPAPTNKSLVLHLSALRDLRDQGHVKDWVWVDTHSNVANAMTKLAADGTLPLDSFTEMLESCYWNPSHPFKVGSIMTAPPTKSPGVSSTVFRRGKSSTWAPISAFSARL